MVHSVLVYRDLMPEEAPAKATIIPLHGNQGSLDDLMPLARTLGSDLRIVAPEAARGMHDSKHFVVGHTWYASVRPEKPEPASFGDSLAQIERFIVDVRERAEPGEKLSPLLLGYGEGAVMSLAAAGVLPDLLSGVVSVCGAIPEIRDWQVLSQAADSLPIMLISDPHDPFISPELVRQTRDALEAWGASVTLHEIVDARKLGGDVSLALRNWLRKDFK